MQFRLLIDLEVIDYLQKQTAARRKRLLDHLRKVQDFPGHYSDLIHHDGQGRRLDISFFDGLAIYYWTDAADKHIKILKIITAE